MTEFKKDHYYRRRAWGRAPENVLMFDGLRMLYRVGSRWAPWFPDWRTAASTQGPYVECDEDGNDIGPTARELLYGRRREPAEEQPHKAGAADELRHWAHENGWDQCGNQGRRVRFVRDDMVSVLQVDTIGERWVVCRSDEPMGASTFCPRQAMEKADQLFPRVPA